MDEDLKIVLTSELEADEEASAQRISAQLPNIAKLINSKKQHQGWCNSGRSWYSVSNSADYSANRQSNKIPKRWCFFELGSKLCQQD